MGFWELWKMTAETPFLTAVSRKPPFRQFLNYARVLCQLIWHLLYRYTSFSFIYINSSTKFRKFSHVINYEMIINNAQYSICVLYIVMHTLTKLYIVSILSVIQLQGIKALMMCI